MFRLSSLTLFGYGCVCEPQKICHRFRGRPQIDNKDCTGGYDKRLRERNSLGLHGFHGCGYAAVDEGQVIISAIRIRTHTQTERIYDIYYKSCNQSCSQEILGIKIGCKIYCNLLILLVGARGFEPPTPCSQSRCATRLRHAPIFLV